MTLDEINTEWELDSKIDRTELGSESLKIPVLHHKYYKIFSVERLRLRKMELEFKNFKLDKYEFYTLGRHDDTPEHWQLPASGRVLKSDSNQYIEGDKDVIEQLLKIEYQKEKVSYLESIIDNVSRRGYSIKNAIDWERWKTGN